MWLLCFLEFPARRNSTFGAQKVQDKAQRIRFIAKKTAWCALHVNGLLELYYFFKRDSTRRLLFLNARNLYSIRDWNISENSLFQRKRAASHKTSMVCTFLNNFFPNFWIRKYGLRESPSRRPELSLLDSFLSGFLKYKSFKTPVSKKMKDKQGITSSNPKYYRRNGK